MLPVAKIIFFSNMLNNIPAINSGGCGIVTLALFRWMKQHYPEFSYQFVFCYRSHFEREDNSYRILRQAIPSVPCHVVLKVNQFYIDSTIITSKSDDLEYILDEFGDVSVLEKTIKEGRNWNPSFKRLNWIPVIEQMFSIDLSDLNYQPNEVQEPTTRIYPKRNFGFTNAIKHYLFPSESSE